ncbi:type I 3-dehydroquinate dehydratase [Fervidibacillus halotolerans]|uniref:3-dehydroquinate dehydratase n=1 Tax=Fervidibacillus halotolerans TaxID=2980027 RepID=A0A9E8RYK0_9BACI|nr:type I 3-dehydroquinate dehydratase [Fervidibacillus halotolerans]WAA12916.1 type I 3-dehydroquinate dehydratase [Fervidibacillus halotolerans]
MKSIVIGKTVIGEGLPKVIVPLTKFNDEDLLVELSNVKSMNPDIIEWRADFYRKVGDLPSVRHLLSEIRTEAYDLPLLFTFRTQKEGGSGDASVSYYQKLLEEVICSRKIEVIDIEWNIAKPFIDSLVDLAEKNGVFVLMSHHNFQNTPSKKEIIDRFRSMEQSGAHMTKIAVMPKDFHDVMTLMEASWDMKTKYATRPFIAISMGKLGMISRMAAGLYGSAATFASGKTSSAPGQIPIGQLRTIFDLLHKG